MTRILEQKVGSEPHVEHMGGGDLLDEKENSHEYNSTAKNQQCLDFISYCSKETAKPMSGTSKEKQQWCPVLLSAAAGMGSDPEEGSAFGKGSTRDSHGTLQCLCSALCCYWQRSAVAAFGLWSYLADGFPLLLFKTTEEQQQSAAACALWWAQWITGWICC